MNFQDLEKKILQEVEGNGKNPFGANSPDLEGVPYTELSASQECVLLQWLDDNDKFIWRTFATMGAEDGTFGVTITKKEDGTLRKKIEFQITGGKDAKIAHRIAQLNKIVLLNAVEFVGKSLEQ